MGRAVADQDFSRYDPNRGVAGLSGNETEAFQRAGSTLGMISPYADRSSELADAGATGFSLSSIGDFMNPHVAATLDPTIRSINEAAQDEKYNISSMARGAGAFGGSRQAILEAENDANRLEKIGDATARAYSDAYGSATDDAMRAHQLNTGNALAASGQFRDLGGFIAGAGDQDIDQLMQTGGVDRGVSQDRADIDRQEHLREQDWNSQRLQDYLSAVSGVPIDRSTTNTEQSQSANLSEVMQLLNSLSNSSGTNTGSGSTQAGTMGTLGGLGGLALVADSLLPAGLFSDKTMKKNRRKVSGKEVLDVLDEIDFDEWEYKHEPGVKRFGPMAQDMEKKAGMSSPRVAGKMTLPPNEMASMAMAGVKALRDEVAKA